MNLKNCFLRGAAVCILLLPFACQENQARRGRSFRKATRHRKIVRRIPVTVRDLIGCEDPDGLVSAGVPFPRGALRSHESLSVLMDGAPIPCQTRILSTWPDGSIKWVLVDYPVSIPQQGQAEAIVAVGDASAKRPSPAHALKVTESKEGLHVDNGVLQFDLRREKFRLFENLVFKGKKFLNGIDGSARKAGQKESAIAAALPLQTLEIEQIGPVKAVIALRGALATAADGTGKLLDFTARLTVAAGAPWVRVEWCLINPGYDLTEVPDPGRKAEGKILAALFHDRAHTPIDLMRLDFDVALPDCNTALLGGDRTRTFHYEVHPPARYSIPFRKGAPELWQSPGRGGCRAWACGHGRDGHEWIDLSDESNPYMIAPRPLHRRMKDGSETLKVSAPVWGWVHMNNGSAGFTVQIQNFYQNRPKSFDLDVNRLTLDLWPEKEGTLNYEEGVSKTHTLTLSFFDTDMRSGHVDTLAAARSQPIVPRLDPEYIQQTGAAGDIFPADPKRYPTLEMTLRIGSRSTARGGQGMMNFGDQGTHNNQYDWQFSCFTYFLRSGLESAFLNGEASTWHSMDVDTIHHHRDPMMFEGIHSGRGSDHTATPVDPHYLYCQGILAYYHLTGHPRALKIASGIARSALRHMRKKGRSGMVFNNGRAAGWSLLCVAAVYEETRDKALRQGLEEYFDRLEEWQDDDGAFRRRVADGHNGYWLGSNAFMNGILLSAIYRAWEATKSERARRIFLKGVDHFMDQMMLPHGIVASTEGPPGENSFGVGTSYGIHGQTQALAWASKLTGDPKYIRRAVRYFNFHLKYNGGLHWTLNYIRMDWWAIFRFLHIADEFDLLDAIERKL